MIISALLLGGAKPIHIPTPPPATRGVTIVNRVPGFKQKLVALTFDDGPSPNITPQILKTLKRYDAKATFFVCGMMVKAYPSMLRRVASAGHAIGNHTWTHKAGVKGKRAYWEVDETQKIIKKVLGMGTQLFRPPYGQKKSTYKAALDRNYAVIMWSASSGDTATKSSEAVYKNVKSCNPGDIILFHDLGTKQHTANALPRIMASLSKKGYKFVTVPELLEAQQEFKASLKQGKRKPKA